MDMICTAEDSFKYAIASKNIIIIGATEPQPL